VFRWVSCREYRSAQPPYAGERNQWHSPVLVVLLDDNAVLGDARELDTLVRDALDRAGGTVYGLDAHTVL